MKRYLLFLAYTAISTGLILGAIVQPQNLTAKLASDVTTPANTKAIQSNKPAKVQTAASVATPVPVKPAQPAQPPQPTKPAFDPNNQATWPTCSDTQVVWASDGQCHDKPVAQVQAAVTAPAAPVGVTVGGCGDNSYANYIYMHESGCSTWNPNQSSGACGLGQAEPCSKLTSQCPGLDYGCENAYFTDYAISRYGSWAGAYNFWVNNQWW